MGTKYSNNLPTGYNVSPPSDDGATTAANKVQWSTIKTKLTDCFNTWASSLNTAILNAFDTSCASLTGNYTTLASDNARTLQCSGTFTVSLGDASTLAAGWFCNIVNAGTGTLTIGRATIGNTLGGVASNITLAPLQATTVVVNQASNGFNLLDCNSLIIDNTDTTKQLRFNVSNIPTGTTVVAATGSAGLLPAGIGPLPYAGSSIPAGWLNCDGSAISRTTYAALFTAIGTNWGAGDGATTFNLPPPGRTPIGDGTASTVETITTALAAANAVPIASNSTKWVTGMAVVVSNASGFVGLVNGSFFIVRVDSTHISIATTLANAQNGTVVVVTGTGNATFTWTGTARTLGQVGGEEAHAMSITELLAHGHTWSATNSSAAIPTVNNTMAGGGLTGTAVAGSAYTPTGVANSTGGNAAMNIMQPFMVVKMIISY